MNEERDEKHGEIDRLSPDKLLKSFVNTQPLAWVLLAIALHVVVIAGTGYGTILDYLNPERVEQREAALKAEREAMMKAQREAAERAARAAEDGPGNDAGGASGDGPAAAGTGDGPSPRGDGPSPAGTGDDAPGLFDDL